MKNARGHKDWSTYRSGHDNDSTRIRRKVQVVNSSWNDNTQQFAWKLLKCVFQKHAFDVAMVNKGGRSPRWDRVIKALSRCRLVGSCVRPDEISLRRPTATFARLLQSLAISQSKAFSWPSNKPQTRPFPPQVLSTQWVSIDDNCLRKGLAFTKNI